MRTSLRRFGTLSLIGLIVAGFAPSASAFFPIGGFDENGLLRLVTWPIKEFDTNNNGVIEQGEGLELYVETGKSGFTDEEAQIVQESFDVWQEVPTSYACFNIEGYFQDPLNSGSSTAPDTRLTVNMYVSPLDDTGESVEPDVLGLAVQYPILGVTLILYTITDEIMTSTTGTVKGDLVEEKAEGQTTTDTGGTVTGSDAYVISAGTIIDCDIVIGATTHRAGVNGEAPLFDLKGTLVHEIGHMVGLGHTPLNNLRGVEEGTGASASILMLVESEEVFWMTDPSGNAAFRGVTPTMFPYYFEVVSQDGSHSDGCMDLAPDDISGISWLYPRGDQSNYFNINQEARTYARSTTGIASQPIVGAHIVAWADVDDDPNTSRIPLFSTFSGLYIAQENINLTGKFSLLDMWKQMEVPRGNGAKFNPSYSITMSPMNGMGFERQSPPSISALDCDAIQGALSFTVSPRSDSDYINVFLSEVFHEVENVIDVSNKDAGTPLVWSFEANTVVSGDTGRTLPTMLPNKKPMFGDENVVCPLNLIGTGTTSTEPEGGTTEGAKDNMVGATLGGGGGDGGPFGPNSLRALRDHVLLTTGVGTALVDLYYQAAPVMARYLLNHGTVYVMFKQFVYGFYWMMDHALAMVAVMAGSFLVAWKLMRRRLSRGAAMTMLLAVALAFAGGQTHALIAYVTTQQITENADAIEMGVVKSVESKWVTGGRIVTEAVVEIEDTVKGGLDKGTQVTITILGGRVGGFVMNVTDMPTFTKDEKVLLYLRDVPKYGYTVYGGERGKLPVYTDKKTGKEYVKGVEAVSELEVKKDEKIVEGQEGDGQIELNAYLDYLRGIVDAQMKAKGK